MKLYGIIILARVAALHSVNLRQSIGCNVVAVFLINIFFSPLPLLSFSFVVYVPHGRCAQTKKNHILEELIGVPQNLGYTAFHTPLAILGPPGGHFGSFRLWLSSEVSEVSLHSN